ncbi:MAG: septum formation initiator family protein [Bacteroidetes bacterium]|nr:septum formation initiator family protein [Bacteroidota bacterium]
MMRKVFRVLKNKFILSLLVLFAWLLFFDNNDIISQIRLQRKISRMKSDREYYIKEIEKNRKELRDLMTNPANLEKFAREKYLMKKDNEEIFVIVKEK